MRGHPVKRSGIVHLLYIFVLSFFCSALKSRFSVSSRLTAAGARRARFVKDGAIARGDHGPEIAGVFRENLVDARESLPGGSLIVWPAASLAVSVGSCRGSLEQRRVCRAAGECDDCHPGQALEVERCLRVSPHRRVGIDRDRHVDLFRSFGTSLSPVTSPTRMPLKSTVDPAKRPENVLWNLTS